MMKNEATLNKIIARFRDNWPGYIKQYRYFLVITLIAAIADMISTCYFMHIEGPDGEVHPAIRFVCILFGPYVGPVIGKLCQLIAIVAVTVYFRKYAVYVFTPVIILYSWAAWYNAWGCRLYYPRLLKLIEYVTG